MNGKTHEEFSSNSQFSSLLQYSKSKMCLPSFIANLDCFLKCVLLVKNMIFGSFFVCHLMFRNKEVFWTLNIKLTVMTVGKKIIQISSGWCFRKYDGFNSYYFINFTQSHN